MAFGVAALVIVVLMFALALIVGSAQQRLIDDLRAKAPSIKRWGGTVLMAVGAWFVALGVFSSFFAGVFSI